MKRIQSASPTPVARPLARVPIGDDSIVIRIPTPSRLGRYAAPMIDMGERVTAAQNALSASTDPSERRALSLAVAAAAEWHEAAMGWYLLCLIADDDWQIDARDAQAADRYPEGAGLYPEIDYGRLMFDEIHALCDASAFFQAAAEVATGRASQRVLDQVSERATFSDHPEG